MLIALGSASTIGAKSEHATTAARALQSEDSAPPIRGLPVNKEVQAHVRHKPTIVGPELAPKPGDAGPGAGWMPIPPFPGGIRPEFPKPVTWRWV